MKTKFPFLYVVLTCVITWVFVINMAQCNQRDSTVSFQLFPVGKVKKDSGRTAIEIYPKYADAILGLNKFSHVIVLYWFHKNDTPEKRKTMRVHPRANLSNPLTGVFATRSPRRPNLIGLSVCKILSIENNIIRIDSIDAFNDTPVLDLKPYIPRMDMVQHAYGPKWVK
jgi:tRNA-Thr(GGU) m(6)t(6)A37 methyltransferase TsaA